MLTEFHTCSADTRPSKTPKMCIVSRTHLPSVQQRTPGVKLHMRRPAASQIAVAVQKKPASSGTRFLYDGFGWYACNARVNIDARVPFMPVSG